MVLKLVASFAWLSSTSILFHTAVSDAITTRQAGSCPILAPWDITRFKIKQFRTTDPFQWAPKYYTTVEFHVVSRGNGPVMEFECRAEPTRYWSDDSAVYWSPSGLPSRPSCRQLAGPGRVPGQEKILEFRVPEPPVEIAFMEKEDVMQIPVEVGLRVIHLGGCKPGGESYSEPEAFARTTASCRFIPGERFIADPLPFSTPGQPIPYLEEPSKDREQCHYWAYADRTCTLLEEPLRLDA